MRFRDALLVGYSAGAYLVFLAAIAYGVGFLGEFGVPTTVDAGVEAAPVVALVVDAALLSVFAVQHSLMARDFFKRRWTRVVPEAAERSTYVLFSSLALLLVFWQWRPVGVTLWRFESLPLVAAAYALFALGWLVALVATFDIDHASLFGLRQAWRSARGEGMPDPEFQTPGLYRYVRHPLMTGLLLAFWATPHMTVGHLLLAGGSTGYVLVGVWLEERDLVDEHGVAYERYRESVPMLVPRPFRGPYRVSDETES